MANAKSSQVVSLGNLGHEVLFEIMLYLNVKDLCSLSEASQLFLELVSSDYHWQRLLLPLDISLVETNAKSWREFYYSLSAFFIEANHGIVNYIPPCCIYWEGRLSNFESFKGTPSYELVDFTLSKVAMRELLRGYPWTLPDQWSDIKPITFPMVSYLRNYQLPDSDYRFGLISGNHFWSHFRDREFGAKVIVCGKTRLYDGYTQLRDDGIWTAHVSEMVLCEEQRGSIKHGTRYTYYLSNSYHGDRLQNGLLGYWEAPEEEAKGLISFNGYFYLVLRGVTYWFDIFTRFIHMKPSTVVCHPQDAVHYSGLCLVGKDLHRMTLSLESFRKPDNDEIGDSRDNRILVSGNCFHPLFTTATSNHRNEFSGFLSVTSTPLADAVIDAANEWRSPYRDYVLSRLGNRDDFGWSDRETEAPDPEAKTQKLEMHLTFAENWVLNFQKLGQVDTLRAEVRGEHLFGFLSDIFPFHVRAT